ncbi:hypothetical protein E2C01_081862 [Portunus trituberculatus]|uniref:Uncharacterized protein n=1 Tax=Portunus trituberculatus TaxID=210409 RepID=A0A5B7J3F6_PORTR|nr:hypothetical protein [Portunus trituberculatus]
MGKTGWVTSRRPRFLGGSVTSSRNYKLTSLLKACPCVGRLISAEDAAPGKESRLADSNMW